MIGLVLLLVEVIWECVGEVIEVSEMFFVYVGING